MPEPVPPAWQLCLQWLDRSTELATESAAALNAMNVFPVSDADTGSNVELTLTGLARAVADLDVGDLEAADMDRVVHAAVLSAHGNSGAILAQMVTSACRSITVLPGGIGTAPGRGLAALLRRAAIAATRAVARPVPGTILTVADDAAEAAETAAATAPGDTLAVARAARAGAAESLQRTPDLLPVLAEAGVVDAGGQAYLLLLDALVEVLGGEPAVPLNRVERATPPPSTTTGPEIEYEVMYALRGADTDRLAELRDRLSDLGSSVVVVGDRTVAQVHVHLVAAGEAVEAGLATGAVSQVRITALPSRRSGGDRAVVAVVAGPGLAEAVSSLGGIPVLPAGGHVTVEELTETLDHTYGDLVILPNDMEVLEIATHLARTLRLSGRRVAVIPTVAQVQGLAAMAVHEPTADFDSAVVGMSSSAGHARHGAVTVAESAALTLAGRCEIGDVLGLVEGDFVDIGTTVPEVAWLVVERLLAFGGELLTLITGHGAPAGLAENLRERIRTTGVDVEVLDGGQRRYPLLVGLE